jgi:hypothetical protein
MRVFAWLLIATLSFQDNQTFSCLSARPPSSANKASAGITLAPRFIRIDKGVMPAIRPDSISDRVSLSDKLGRGVRRLVAEEGAVDTLLSAVVDKFPPGPACIACVSSKDEFFSRPNKLESGSVVGVFVTGVMSLI